MNKQYKLLCKDSVEWLTTEVKPKSFQNIITGLPDLNEIKSITPDLKSYVKWFCNVATLLFTAISDNGYCIFIQTDRKLSGKHNPPTHKFEWISKSNLLIDTAKQCDIPLLWHKIACYHPIGEISTRPSYGHILCFSRKGIQDVRSKFPDVIMATTKMYDNSTPIEAAEFCVNFILEYYKSSINKNTLPYNIVDPFIGQGTTGIVSLSKGLTILGNDIDPNQIEKTTKHLDNIINTSK